MGHSQKATKLGFTLREENFKGRKFPVGVIIVTTFFFVCGIQSRYRRVELALGNIFGTDVAVLDPVKSGVLIVFSGFSCFFFRVHVVAVGFLPPFFSFFFTPWFPR